METTLEKRVGFQMTKLGWIPDDWEIESLGKLGETLNGLTYSPNDIHEDGILVLRSSNVQKRQVVFEDNVYVKVQDEKFNKVHENDILICVRNGSRSLIGKNALITKEAEGLAFGAFMSIYRSPLNKYIIHLLDTDLYYGEIHKNLGATINSINGSDLRKFKFPIPPKRERDKIAQILSAWDQVISDTQNLVEQLKSRKKGLMQQVFKGKIRLKKKDGSSFPNWKKENLGYYLKVSGKKNSELVFNNDNVLSVSGEYGIVNQIELQGRSFAGASVANYGVVETGDIVYTKSPLKANPYGIFKVNKGPTGIVSTLYAVYKCKPTVNGEFVDYYFQLDDNTNRYLRPLVQKGSKNDMKINNDKVLIDPVLFPALDEQNTIVDFFKSVDEEIKAHQLKLIELESQKKGLMQQLLTGQKRVKI